MANRDKRLNLDQTLANLSDERVGAITVGVDCEARISGTLFSTAVDLAALERFQSSELSC